MLACAIPYQVDLLIVGHDIQRLDGFVVKVIHQVLDIKLQSYYSLSMGLEYLSVIDSVYLGRAVSNLIDHGITTIVRCIEDLIA